MDDRRLSTETTPPPRPLWVKVLAITAAIVVALLIVVAVASGGEHGPGRHAMGSEDPAGHALVKQRA